MLWDNEGKRKRKRGIAKDGEEPTSGGGRGNTDGKNKTKFSVKRDVGR